MWFNKRFLFFRDIDGFIVGRVECCGRGRGVVEGVLERELGYSVLGFFIYFIY